MGLNLDFDKLLKDIAKALVADEAIRIHTELVGKATSVMGEFYGDYSPKYYRRTGGAAGLYIENTFKKTGELSYRVGVKFSSSAMGGHKDPADYLFHGIFDMGIHGVSSIAVMSPSPNTIMEDFLNSL